MAGLRTIEKTILAVIAVLTAIAGWLHYAFEPGVPAFLFATGALAGLAWVVSFATEQLGESFGPEVTGLMQSTLGNLPEFFVVLFALSAGEVVVAQTSIVGSIFANALFVLGLAIVAGARREADGTMRFSPRLPNDTATLLLLAVFIIVTVGISTSANDRASAHIDEISIVGAICLLVVYAGWVVSYVRSGAKADPLHKEAPRVRPAASGVLLAFAGVGAAFVSEWFVSSLNPAIDAFGVSQAFAGMVIVAIASNAIENATGVVLAAKGQADLAISVVKNSVAQIAVFLFPALVLVSFAFDEHLTFQMPGVYIGALALTAIIVWQVTSDGVAAMWEGMALIAFYVILATVTLYE